MTQEKLTTLAAIEKAAASEIWTQTNGDEHEVDERAIINFATRVYNDMQAEVDRLNCELEQAVHISNSNAATAIKLQEANATIRTDTLREVLEYCKINKAEEVVDYFDVGINVTYNNVINHINSLLTPQTK